MTFVGAVSALPQEERCLVGRRSPLSIRSGQPETRLRLAVSGVGPERAGHAAEALLDQGATALLSWGFAGALVPELRPGTLVAPERIEGASSGPIDPNWRRRLLAHTGASSRIIGGKLAHSDSTLEGPTQKHRLALETGAVAVDQESAAVAAVAARAGVPFLAIRAILDPVELRLPPRLTKMAADSGTVTATWALLTLLRHPGELQHLARLAMPLRQAKRSLRGLARRVGSQLGG